MSEEDVNSFLLWHYLLILSSTSNEHQMMTAAAPPYYNISSYLSYGVSIKKKRLPSSSSFNWRLTVPKYYHYYHNHGYHYRYRSKEGRGVVIINIDRSQEEQSVVLLLAEMTTSSSCVQPDMTLITADATADDTAADNIDDNIAAAAADDYDDINWTEFPPPQSSQWGGIDDHPSLLQNVVNWDDETEININNDNNDNKSGDDKLSFDESEFWSFYGDDETTYTNNNIFRTANVVIGSDSNDDDVIDDDNLDVSNYFDDLEVLFADFTGAKEAGGGGDYSKTATTMAATHLKEESKSSLSPRERRNTDQVCMNRLNGIVEKLSPTGGDRVVASTSFGADSTEDASSSPVSVAVVLPSSSSSPPQQPQLFESPTKENLAASSLLPLPLSPDNNVAFQGALNRVSFLSERLTNDMKQRKQRLLCTEDKENESPQLKQTYSSNNSVGIHLLETRLLLNKLTLQAEEEEMSYQLDTRGQHQQCKSNSINNKSARKEMDGDKEEYTESLIIHMRKISQLSNKCRELQQQLDKDEKVEKKKRTTVRHGNRLERQLEISLKCDKERRLEYKMKALEDKYDRTNKKKNKKKGELRGGEEGRLRLLSEGESRGRSNRSSNNNWELHRQWRKGRINKARNEYLECLAANCDEESVNLVKKLFS